LCGVWFICWSLSGLLFGRCPERLPKNNYWRLNASRSFANSLLRVCKVYATLLNCWKFLRACLYQVEMGNLRSMACNRTFLFYLWGMVRIKSGCYNG
jgi:hypothetical protein